MVASCSKPWLSTLVAPKGRDPEQIMLQFSETETQLPLILRSVRRLQGRGLNSNSSVPSGPQLTLSSDRRKLTGAAAAGRTGSQLLSPSCPGGSSSRGQPSTQPGLPDSRHPCLLDSKATLKYAREEGKQRRPCYSRKLTI
ncbi:hypothetical protein H671_2g5147 [Cricetulus griseus]|nr:hypothetical protein H671_2g5147 [Cricetulus griseus]